MDFELRVCLYAVVVTLTIAIHHYLSWKLILILSSRRGQKTGLSGVKSFDAVGCC